MASEERAASLHRPFYHLNLDHVLVVRASGASLSVENWAAFVRNGTGKVCYYGGKVGDAMGAVFTDATRLIPSPSRLSETEAHAWAADQLRAEACAVYVQPKDKAENMLAEFSPAGGCDLRLIQPSSSQALGLGSYGGGFSTVLPFARELQVRAVSGDPSATAGGGACTDLASAAFTHILQKMHHQVYAGYRRSEIETIQARSGAAVRCSAQECESGQLDLGFACAECDAVSLECNQRYSVYVREGYYRATVAAGFELYSVGPRADAISAWPCTLLQACRGGIATGNASCATGHGGVLCATCEAGYHKAQGSCEPCDADNPGSVERGSSSALASMMGICLGILLVLSFWAVSFLRRGLQLDAAAAGAKDGPPLDAKASSRLDDSNAALDDRNLTLQQRLQLEQKFTLKALIDQLPWEMSRTGFKIILGYLQCLSIFLHLNYVYWPANFLDFLRTCEWVSLIDIWMLLKADCIAGTSLGFRFDFYTSIILIPAFAAYTVLLALIAALSTGAKLTWYRLSTPRAWELLQWGLLFLYPLVSVKCFQTFDCIEYDDGVRLLRAEPAMPCYEGAHATLATVSIVVIAVFCFGLPAYFFLATYSTRQPYSTRQLSSTHQPSSARQPPPDTRSFFSLLTTSYRPNYFFFESVDLLRKLLISSSLMIMWPRTRLQLFLGVCFSVAFTVVFIWCRPYKLRIFNYLQMAACTTIVLTFAGAMVFLREEGKESSNEWCEAASCLELGVISRDFSSSPMILHDLPRSPGARPPPAWSSARCSSPSTSSCCSRSRATPSTSSYTRSASPPSSTRRPTRAVPPSGSRPTASPTIGSRPSSCASSSCASAGDCMLIDDDDDDDDERLGVMRKLR